MQEKIHFESGVTLYQNPYLNMQEHVALTGTVTYAPPGHKYPGIGVGTKLYFRYDVVFDGDFDRETGSRTYNNMLMMPDGTRQWFVHPVSLIGYEKDGRMVLVNDLVLAKPTAKKAWTSSILVHSDQFEQEKTEEIVEVLQDDRPDGVPAGSRCLAVKETIQHYNFTNTYGKDILVLNAKYLVAKLN